MARHLAETYHTEFVSEVAREMVGANDFRGNYDEREKVERSWIDAILDN
jgi:hypothetical protein